MALVWYFCKLREQYLLLPRSPLYSSYNSNTEKYTRVIYGLKLQRGFLCRCFPNYRPYGKQASGCTRESSYSGGYVPFPEYAYFQPKCAYLQLYVQSLRGRVMKPLHPLDTVY